MKQEDPVEYGHYCVQGGHPTNCRWCAKKLIIVIQARICENCDSPKGKTVG